MPPNAVSHPSHPMVMPTTNSLAAPVNVIGATSVSAHNSGLLDGLPGHVNRNECVINKRPRLSMEPKYTLAQNNMHQPLMIDTWPGVEMKKVRSSFLIRISNLQSAQTFVPNVVGYLMVPQFGGWPVSQQKS